MLRVREAAEKAKRELSGQMSTQVTLPFLTQDANGPHHLDVTVTRAQFEGMTRDLVERTCGPVSQVMTDAALSMSDLGPVSYTHLETPMLISGLCSCRSTVILQVSASKPWPGSV